MFRNLDSSKRPSLGSIEGRKYQQENLDSNLTCLMAGQSTKTKFILFILIVFLCILISFSSSYAGGGLAFLAVTKSLHKPEFLLIVLDIAFWLSITSILGWRQGVWITILLTSLLLFVPKILEYSGVIRLTRDFVVSLILNLIFQFVVCSITFLAFRLIAALIEVVFYRSKWIKATVIVSMLLVSLSAGLRVFSDSLKNIDLSNEQAFTSRLNAAYVLKTITILSGLGLTSSLLATSWLANRRRLVPWHYPDVIRDFALVVGSWGGTSFYDLDLSNVNFSGTTLSNTDLRAQRLYRTCFQGVVGLERARVDNQYLDLAYPIVQKLLTHGCSSDPNFRKFNLPGAYLQNADMRGFDLTDTNLIGADLKDADLRGSILIRTQLAGSDFQGVDLRRNVLIDANLTEADFRGADLRDCILVRTQIARTNFEGADMTGICIEDWSVSSKTNFTNVRCDYVFKQYENGQPSHRYPVDRNFEPGEFAALFQHPQNELELIFKGDFSYSALSLAFYKLQTEEPELNLELKGIEQRGNNLWVVRVTGTNPTVEPQLEQEFSTFYQTTTDSSSVEASIKDSIYRDYEDIKQRWAESQQLVRQLTGISESQAEALKQLSKQALGTNFFIEGSNITNLTGQGQIEYTEAAGQIRSLVTRGGTEAQISQGAQQVLSQLQDIATTPPMQTELIQQILLREAQSDPAFRRFLLQQQQQILTVLPPGTIATAIQKAIAQLNSESSGNVV